MGVVALGCVRSCGVTTLAAALAATWPEGRRVLLAELDPAGGTLAGASGWPPEPGIVSLAAAVRRRPDREAVWGHCQHLPGGAAVLAGPASPERARSALALVAGVIGRLGELDAEVLVDCGRLDPGSPVFATFTGADRAVLVARPSLGDLHVLATWLETHRPERPELVLVGDGPYPPAEVADALSISVLGMLPWDPPGASAAVSEAVSHRGLARSPLLRAARTLAERLTAPVPEERSADGLLVGHPDAQSPSDAVSAHRPATAVEAGS